MSIKQFKNTIQTKLYVLSLGLFSFFYVNCAYAAGGGGGGGNESGIGGVADQIVGNFSQLAKLITAGAYIAGLGFAVGAILKFKAHKDNPTQIPIGTPIALIFIAAALIFMPSIFTTAGKTLFQNASTAGPSGISTINV